jgi:hypothetical protein
MAEEREREKAFVEGKERRTSCVYIGSYAAVFTPHVNVKLPCVH